MSRRRNTTLTHMNADALTWLFAGLAFIGLVAGILGQIAS
jgi:hypothetical protein